MNVFDTVNTSDTTNASDTTNTSNTTNASDTANTSDTANALFMNTFYGINSSLIFPNTSEISGTRDARWRGSPNTTILVMYLILIVIPLWANRRARKRFSKKLQATRGTPSRLIDLFSTYIIFHLFIYISYTIFWASRLFDTAYCFLDDECTGSYFKEDVGFAEFWYSVVLQCLVSVGWFLGEVKSHWTPVPYWGSVTDGLHTTVYNGRTRTIYFDGTTTITTKGLSSTVISMVTTTIVPAVVTSIVTTIMPTTVTALVPTTVTAIVPTTISTIVPTTVIATVYLPLTQTVSKIIDDATTSTTSTTTKSILKWRMYTKEN